MKKIVKFWLHTICMAIVISALGYALFALIGEVVCR